VCNGLNNSRFAEFTKKVINKESNKNWIEESTVSAALLERRTLVLRSEILPEESKYKNVTAPNRLHLDHKNVALLHYRVTKKNKEGLSHCSLSTKFVS
jgi:hypothetical protein